MNRLNQILVAVLALQIVIAGGIYFAGKPATSTPTQAALLDFDRQDVSRVTIVGEDGEQAVLSKSGDGWQLPEYHQLPADADKLGRTLDELASTRSGWPVATTAAGRERFKVEDDNFHTKIILGSGDKILQTLYIGTSPGYRQVNVRRDGDDEVYAVKLDDYAISPDNGKWLQATLLRPDGEISALRGPGFELRKVDGQWQTASAGGEVVAEEADKLGNSLAQLRVTGAADQPAVDADYLLKVDTAGGSFSYRFFKDGDKRFVMRNDYDQAFEINKSAYDDIVGATAGRLISGTGSGEHSSMDDSRHGRANSAPAARHAMQAAADDIV